jgi:membrane fusion protein (multidrug efflux system)
MDKKKTNSKFIFIFGALILLGGGYGIYKYVHAQSHEETDDAQIERNMSPVIARVTGYVDRVYVKDNDYVKKGDTLFTIDNKDYLVKVAEANAALLAAEGNFAAAKADIGSATANISYSQANKRSAAENIETARIRLRRATNDFERYSNLYKNRSITLQQYEQAEAAKQEAEAQLRILEQQEKASAHQTSVAASRANVTGKQSEVAQANISRAQAQLEAAKLNLSYTVVTAAADGQVSKISLQPGQLVQPGASLFYIINNDETWVVANFKETQLNKMVAGQKVIVKVDAFPDTEFEAEVASFSPATGSRFSILPPDNATGNFVKTIQRLPVKIKFTAANQAEMLQKLRPGMNAEVDVHVN